MTIVRVELIPYHGKLLLITRPVFSLFLASRSHSNIFIVLISSGVMMKKISFVVKIPQKYC